MKQILSLAPCFQVRHTSGTAESLSKLDRAHTVVRPWYFGSSSCVLMPGSAAKTKEHKIPKHGSRPNGTGSGKQDFKKSRVSTRDSHSLFQPMSTTTASTYNVLCPIGQDCSASEPHHLLQLELNPVLLSSVEPFCKSAFPMNTSKQFQEKSLFFYKGLYGSVSV